MLASKAGSERISLKILFKDDIPANGLLFTFTNPSSREDDRLIVQDTLIPFVSSNRAGPSTPVPVVTTGIASPATGTPGTPTGVVGNAARGKRKAEDGLVEANGRGGGGKDLVGSKLRMRVLKKNPNLMILHRELVLGKQITEDEFWEGREVGQIPLLRSISTLEYDA